MKQVGVIASHRRPFYRNQPHRGKTQLNCISQAVRILAIVLTLLSLFGRIGTAVYLPCGRFRPCVQLDSHSHSCDLWRTSRPVQAAGPQLCSKKESSAAAYFRCSVALVIVLTLFPVLAAQAQSSVSWFGVASMQKVSSASTAPTDQGTSLLEQVFPQTLSTKQVFKPPPGQKLPYPDIPDNTEGAAAFADVLDLLPTSPSGRSPILLDIGGGRSNAPKRFIEAAKPGWRVVVADPYNRPEAENAAAQRAVEEGGGADVVTSMSVLNVIPEQASRFNHIELVHNVVRPGGRAIFKVWAGLWPERGTGTPQYDSAQDSFQANAWASAFLPEVESVFGKGNAYADNNLNLILAIRQP